MLAILKFIIGMLNRIKTRVDTRIEEQEKDDKDCLEGIKKLVDNFIINIEEKIKNYE